MSSTAKTRRTRAQNSEYVVDSLKSIGLQPHPESRLTRMHRVLSQHLGAIAPDHADFEIALEAERDMQVLGFVFDNALGQPADSEFVRLAKNAIKDSLLPQDDRSLSKGRDAQFELFIAAVCQAAGMRPVVREEPDVTCLVNSTKFGIAAKRIKNIANLEARIKKGAQQIQDSRLPGFIALDTSIALNRDNQRISTPIHEQQFQVLYWSALRRFMDAYHDRIQDWVRGKGVRGVIVHDQQVRFLQDGDWTLSGMTMRVNTARENARRQREYRLFELKYVSGLPNLEHLN